MGAQRREKVAESIDSNLPASLGTFIKKARQDLSMTLRQVEEATNREVSNGYLSQLESDKIAKPSPHVLLSLANVLSVDYETLMKRAGYFLPAAPALVGKKLASERNKKAGAEKRYSIENLSADEEKELLEYLSFLRQRKKK